MSGFKAAKGSDPDAPTFLQAMQSAQVEYWVEVITLELSKLERRGTWTELHCHNLSEGANLISGTWAFKIKRFPDGRFRKFKARFCVRGDIQLEGIDFFHTYAPVVQWLMMRMMLILSALLELSSLQVNSSNAFAQHLKINYCTPLSNSLHGVHNYPHFCANLCTFLYI
jgi:hypothetical protein